MKNKTDNKMELIYQSTIELLNEIGLSDISMSKIAKRASISSSSIYFYFESKEDLLIKLYFNLKDQMHLLMFKGVTEDMPVKDGFEKILRNYSNYIINNQANFLLMEQFLDAPFIRNNCNDHNGGVFKPLYPLFEKGVREGLFKDSERNLLITYSCLPFVQIGKEYINGEYDLSSANIEKMIQMSWNAIKA
ncbi:TetR/AcrR family transcriptional regulator [Paenibacillus radicis (ex Gao et al. 2016)]|uniref:TetR family transcriptional regulator n=1 Tax=Paenibacillus radicis (ex Gao et al. 2016) TaxID=1737354 RepID=A0A917H6S0_9BACL|nr:TetR/AcrR family transcriptional regulator [Paenibacillus radicis (ex Gao et al. 2016)]GGG69963.1 TetR family transcriptional regulator [Paenibacillus radicis (ex Gao et al. 2016)]